MVFSVVDSKFDSAFVSALKVMKKAQTFLVCMEAIGIMQSPRFCIIFGIKSWLFLQKSLDNQATGFRKIRNLRDLALSVQLFTNTDTASFVIPLLILLFSLLFQRNNTKLYRFFMQSFLTALLFA
ncbi:hypothetical protein EGR_10324 [Echinococcus granulosus]|uniref:Uncharacterized protein n=1 Tax=Echinococcus granulosus TaxID=6210 RepID=W6U8L7_ECHGR|nr:hypothetical protein EGR_10324 [Echinococcus granulosus]EUB54817.1 hypothetical protein EGR_10324 [Echinococcus granulosus]